LSIAKIRRPALAAFFRRRRMRLPERPRADAELNYWEALLMVDGHGASLPRCLPALGRYQVDYSGYKFV
jgi:hypothetical protein